MVDIPVVDNSEVIRELGPVVSFNDIFTNDDREQNVNKQTKKTKKIKKRKRLEKDMDDIIYGGDNVMGGGGEGGGEGFLDGIKGSLPTFGLGMGGKKSENDEEDDREFRKIQMLQQFDEYCRVKPELKDKFKKPKPNESYESVLNKLNNLESEAFDSIEMRKQRLKDIYLKLVQFLEDYTSFPIIGYNITGATQIIKEKVETDTSWKTTMDLIAIKYKYYLGYGSNPLIQLGYLTYNVFDKVSEENRNNQNIFKRFRRSEPTQPQDQNPNIRQTQVPSS
jgi:hypothetical protein